MKLEGIRLRNFKAFRDIDIQDLPRFAVFVGANGSGKTSLFSVFSFLCFAGIFASLSRGRIR